MLISASMNLKKLPNNKQSQNSNNLCCPVFNPLEDLKIVGVQQQQKWIYI